MTGYSLVAPWANTELMFTIAPERLGTITLAASREARNVPVRLTSITCCHWASVCSSSGLRIGGAGVVHQDVHGAERVDCCCDERGDAALVADVRRHGDRLDAVLVAKLLRNLFQKLRPPRGDDDSRSRFGETPRELLPEPVGAAGDDRDPSLEPALAHQRAVTSV